MAPTTQSIMMTKITHHIRDGVGIIGGVQHTDRHPAGQILGGPDPCNPYGVDAYGCKQQVS